MIVERISLNRIILHTFNRSNLKNSSNLLILDDFLIWKEKSDPPRNQGFSFRLRAILKSSKILDFEDFDFQNTQNQQFSKMKTLRSPRISEKMTKKYVF